MNEGRYDVTTRLAQELHDPFFSSPPGVEVFLEKDEFEQEEPAAPSRELLERRSKLRRLVGSLVAAFSLFTLVAFAGSSPAFRTAAGEPAEGEAAEGKKKKGENMPPRELSVKVAHLAGAGTRPSSSLAATPTPRVSSPERTSLFDVTLPDSFPKSASATFSQAKESLEIPDFEAADAALSGLCTSEEKAVRDHARLVRALIWVEQGRGDLVRVVFEDLFAHSTIASVRSRARRQLYERAPAKMPTSLSYSNGP